MSAAGKRILLVNDHIHFGGGGDAVFRLQRRFLESQGFEVYTFSHAAALPKDATERDLVHPEGRSGVWRKVKKFTANPGAGRAFREALATIDPHLVHLHLISEYPTSIYAQLGGRATIQTLHGVGFLCATGWGCLRKDSAYCELGVGLKCAARGCIPAWRLPLLYSLHRRWVSLVKKTVHCFLCPSRQLLEDVRRHGLAPAEYAPLGIDRDFCNVLPAAHDGPPVILFVGALAPQKGPDYLLEAFIRLKNRIPELRLRFAGRGTMLDQLQAQARRAGVLADVEFLGFVDRPGLVRQYQEAHVLAVPSIWKEQFGMIGPEALACGTPCVASNIGGIPEWLHDGQWGFLVPPRDPGALAEKLELLLRDRQLRRSFGEKGRAFVLEHFGPDQYEQNLLRIIKRYLPEPVSA
jgi:glycosyltransferase involved in cell wall biosynthesis